MCSINILNYCLIACDLVWYYTLFYNGNPYTTWFYVMSVHLIIYASSHNHNRESLKPKNSPIKIGRESFKRAKLHLMLLTPYTPWVFHHLYLQTNVRTYILYNIGNFCFYVCVFLIFIVIFKTSHSTVSLVGLIIVEVDF